MSTFVDKTTRRVSTDVDNGGVEVTRAVALDVRQTPFVCHGQLPWATATGMRALAALVISDPCCLGPLAVSGGCRNDAKVAQGKGSNPSRILAAPQSGADVSKKTAGLLKKYQERTPRTWAVQLSRRPTACTDSKMSSTLAAFGWSPRTDSSALTSR
jgi:hypothetical protein